MAGGHWLVIQTWQITHVGVDEWADRAPVQHPVVRPRRVGDFQGTDDTRSIRWVLDRL
jgi:hypothetical protein